MTATPGTHAAPAEELNTLALRQPPFAHHIGIKVTHVSRERIEAEMLVSPQHANRNGMLHGGAVMALADNLGGTATVANLPEGMTTATIESKTNFFATVALGDTVRAVCAPLHRGRTTMVWQTRVTRSDGRLAAVITQTQLVMPVRIPGPRRSGDANTNL